MAEGQSRRTCRGRAGGGEIALNDAPRKAIEAAIGVLTARTTQAKTERALALQALIADLHRCASIDLAGAPVPPERPARPERPPLVAPGEVPRRRLSSPGGRIALLHAVAHIEFNAIDLAADMAARFAGDVAARGLDARQFLADWLTVCVDEARHFRMLADELHRYGAAYGDLPAHDGLWAAALATRGDALARLVVAPMILEARGLDVTPGMIARLRAAGDERSADALEVIYKEEVAHVAAGWRWFKAFCAADGLDEGAAFRERRQRYFAGALKPPFNFSARDAAGLPRMFYASDDAERRSGVKE